MQALFFSVFSFFFFFFFPEIALKLNSLLLWKEARVKNNWMWERTKGRLPFLRLQSPLRRWCRARRIVLLSAAIPPSPARHSAPEKSLLMSDNQGEFSKSCHFQMTVYTLCGETAKLFRERRGPRWSCTVKERHLMATCGTTASVWVLEKKERGRGIMAREQLLGTHVVHLASFRVYGFCFWCDKVCMCVSVIRVGLGEFKKKIFPLPNSSQSE